MRQVQLHLHPLSRRVLLAEYGAEPFIVPNHDFLFVLLTANKIRDRSTRHQNKLTAAVTIAVDEAFARHIEDRQRSIGIGILAFHFQVLCRFADAALKTMGRGNVKGAIEQWLLLHQIDENEYSAETAYKLWQRHSWNLAEKNSVFFGRMRGKSAGGMSKKNKARANTIKPLNPCQLTLTEMQVELAASRFITAVTACFSRPPIKIQKHARVYYYMEFGGLSCREVADKLRITKSTASYAHRVITRRAQQNPTFGKMLKEASDMRPTSDTAMPAPSGNVQPERNRTELRPHPRRSETACAD